MCTNLPYKFDMYVNCLKSRIMCVFFHVILFCVWSYHLNKTEHLFELLILGARHSCYNQTDLYQPISVVFVSTIKVFMLPMWFYAATAIMRGAHVIIKETYFTAFMLFLLAPSRCFADVFLCCHCNKDFKQTKQHGYNIFSVGCNK